MGMALPSGHKLTLGLLATITLEVVHVMRMHRHSTSALDHLSCVKMAISSIRETEKGHREPIK
jgi:hypothetical protein